MAKTLRLNEIDNVAIALSALEAGEDIATTASGQCLMKVG